MISTFGNVLAEDLFNDNRSRTTSSFPAELRRVARRKLLYLHDAADLRKLRAPPSNRLESLKGGWKGFHSIRIDDQWRLVFKWSSGRASDVRVIDYQ